MEKKSMGKFIAALRKASGMTQQEVADRLNVSNKAVSRWERDECAPDLSLIPALAELYNVTCDEILKGERIFAAAPEEKSEPKVEKQIKMLIRRAVRNFQTMIWISLAIAAVGLICMFGISYGFYRPVIGFSVMLLFEVASFAVAMIAVNKLRNMKADHELLETADESLTEPCDRSLGRDSFLAFFFQLAVLLLSLPLICVRMPYEESVLAAESYFTLFFPVIALVLALLFLNGKEPYAAWLTGRERTEPVDRRVRRMNFLQLGAVVMACLLFVISSYCSTSDLTSSVSAVFAFLSVAFVAVHLLCFFGFLFKYREDRRVLVMPGIRNLLMLISWWLFARSCSGVVIEYHGEDIFHGSVIWDVKCLCLSIGWAFLVTVVFAVIGCIAKKKAV